MKRIAIIGSAPSSAALAPYNDPSWTIWGCSPGAMPHFLNAKRTPDVWYEIHKFEPGKPWFQPDYCGFMANIKSIVYMIDRVPQIPCSTALPIDMILHEFRPFATFFMSSTPAYMIAMAILAKADEIGLWGVDMSAEEEWEDQRPACQFWCCLAEHMGIKVTLPPQSDLLRPPVLYGLSEADHMWTKLTTRDEEITGRVNALDQQIQAAANEKMFLLGAKANNRYTKKTWVHDRRALDRGVQWWPQPPIPPENKEEAIAKVAAAVANGHAQPEAAAP